jgi:hypothetical protein
MKTISVSPKILGMCSVKARKASDLTLDECQSLKTWCDWQAASLWEGLNLQEILNVYRATAQYETLEGWAEEDWRAAYKAWNRAVRPENHMKPREA